MSWVGVRHFSFPWRWEAFTRWAAAARGEGGGGGGASTSALYQRQGPEHINIHLIVYKCSRHRSFTHVFDDTFPEISPIVLQQCLLYTTLGGVRP